MTALVAFPRPEKRLRPGRGVTFYLVNRSADILEENARLG